ncbi:MAG: hypothetical protein QXK71_04185, partial [Pyrobaculum sp.]
CHCLHDPVTCKIPHYPPPVVDYRETRNYTKSGHRKNIVGVYTHSSTHPRRPRELDKYAD